jgi:hypothetical protein
VECLCGMKPQGGGTIKAWGVGWPLEKMSCLVLLRTGMSRELDHRTLRTHHSSLFGRGTDVDLLGRCHYCWVVSR